MKTIYISGPMTGRKDFNFPAFDEAAAELREKGYDVVNPAEINRGMQGDWKQYLRRDIFELFDCEAVATLPEWWESDGSRLEVHIARTLGIDVKPLSEWPGL